MGSNRIAIWGKQIQAEAQMVSPPPPLQESGSGFLQEKREEDEVSCIKEEFIGAG